MIFSPSFQIDEHLCLNHICAVSACVKKDLWTVPGVFSLTTCHPSMLVNSCGPIFPLWWEFVRKNWFSHWAKFLFFFVFFYILYYKVWQKRSSPFVGLAKGCHYGSQVRLFPQAVYKTFPWIAQTGRPPAPQSPSPSHKYAEPAGPVHRGVLFLVWRVEWKKRIAVWFFAK